MNAPISSTIAFVVRLHHLAFRTDDVGDLAAFFREWLGLRVVRDEQPRAVWLELAGPSVVMIEKRSPGEPAIPPGSLELVAFRVGEAEHAALRARLVAAGRLEAETTFTLYFRDPDGRRIGVSTFPLGGDSA